VLGLSKWVFLSLGLFGFLKPKNVKSLNFRVFKFLKTFKNSSHKSNFSFFFKFFFTCVTNLLQMIFKYELRFVAFTWPNICLRVVILCPAFVS